LDFGDVRGAPKPGHYGGAKTTGMSGLADVHGGKISRAAIASGDRWQTDGPSLLQCSSPL